jgi:glycosyltransferase involved in cell wall biosynthesis
MLSSWAARHHRWKKQIAWVLFQRRDFAGASLLHATSRQELEDCRRAGFGGPIAVIPNGVELPIAEDAPAMKRETRVALCVARLHPVKGLINLVEAWNKVRPSGWKMIVAGGDENGHQAVLEARIAACGLADTFEFLGAVARDVTRALYQEAELFILPSHSENFGMGIAEALSHAVPVITTQGTPWHDLIEHRCGWWEEVGAEPLARALLEATGLSPEEREEMGKRGRELVARKYSWLRVAAEFKAIYSWLLAEGERPNCVVV